MKYKIIQETRIDATTFIENLVHSEMMLKEQVQLSPQSSHQSTPQSSLQSSPQSSPLSSPLSSPFSSPQYSPQQIPLSYQLPVELYIQDQFGQVYQAVSKDQYKNKKSLQNLKYFLIRRYVYKMKLNSELLTAICESIRYTRFTSIVIKSKSLIYTYIQWQDKIRVRRSKKILRSLKINQDPKNFLHTNVLHACTKYVVVGSFFDNKALFLINQYTGRCEQHLKIKNTYSEINQIDTAISKNVKFFYISPKLYVIKPQSELMEFYEIKVTSPQFSQDSSKLLGFDKKLSKIMIVDIKNRNYAKIHIIFYDFSVSLNWPLFINFENSQLVINEIQREKKNNYQLIQTIIGFKKQHQ